MKYTAVQQQIFEYIKKEEPHIRKYCKSIFYDAGFKTEKVVLIYHGYTSSPKQFTELGEQIHNASGYNVFIPRLPRHGLKDRMTADLTNLRVDELKQFVHETIDIANHLGKEITIVGFSAGGALATWSGIFVNNTKVKKIIAISPFFNSRQTPTILMPQIMFFVDKMRRDRFYWWKPLEKEKMLPMHAYPRFSLKAIKEILKLSIEIQKQLFVRTKEYTRLVAKSKQKNSLLEDLSDREFVLISNPSDLSVNNKLSEKIFEYIKTGGKSNVRIFSFSQKLNLPHDLIDPTKIVKNKEYVYKQIISFI